MSSGWGCPHEVDGQCNKVAGRPCDPGMKGCVLAGRYVFFNDDKNTRLRQKQAGAAAPITTADPAPEFGAGLDPDTFPNDDPKRDPTPGPGPDKACN